MPDIDTLMEEWPPQVEEALKENEIPGAELEATLAEYAKIACALLDIPFYDNLVEPLHVLFSLYLEFSDNVHFKNEYGGGPEAQRQQIAMGAEAK